MKKNEKLISLLQTLSTLRDEGFYISQACKEIMSGTDSVLKKSTSSLITSRMEDINKKIESAYDTYCSLLQEIKEEIIKEVKPFSSVDYTFDAGTIFTLESASPFTDPALFLKGAPVKWLELERPVTVTLSCKEIVVASSREDIQFKCALVCKEVGLNFPEDSPKKNAELILTWQPQDSSDPDLERFVTKGEGKSCLEHYLQHTVNNKTENLKLIENVFSYKSL